MKIIDIPGGQGSEAWHRHRREHFNASDAPAMMGCSPHKTRAQLLHETHTGLAAEVDAATQRRFDDGHRFEALARPVAERLVGEDLYPIIVASGRLSASLDGVTLDQRTNFEHKSLNDELRACFDEIDRTEGANGSLLPLHFRVQMEHQMHCSGSERTLFMASRWNADSELIEERHCWYFPDLELRAQILAGWEQFAADLAVYVPTEAAPVVTAAPQEHLPALSVQLQGALAVVSNLQPFGMALRAFIAKIPAKPSTDQEFADTEAACKRLKEAEDRLQAAEDSALSSMSDVEAMRRMVAEFRDLARTTRLASEKLVKARKEQIREEEVRRGQRALAEHNAALNARVGEHIVPGVAADFAGAIKGLKTLDSVRNAIDTELARAKIEANALADKIDANLKAIDAAGAPSLFPDRPVLVLKAADDLAAVISQRLAAEHERQEAERARIRAEEERRAAAELQARQAAPTAYPEGQDSQHVLKAEPAKADATDRENPANASPDGGPMGSGQAAAAAPAVARADITPTLSLGAINGRLGFTVSEGFLAGLGFTATRDRSARLYHEDQWPLICRAISEHVLKVGGVK